MHIDARWIDTIFHAQRAAGLYASLQLLSKLIFRHDLLGAAADDSELFVDGFHLFEE
jgi:hypothetical protein